MTKVRAVALAGLETVAKNDKLIFAETFMNNIKTWKKDHSEAVVLVLDARDFRNDVNPMHSIWTAMRNAYGGEGIDQLVYSGHSDQDALYVISRYQRDLQDEMRFINKASTWADVLFSDGAEIWLQGCQTAGQNGKRWDDCIAQSIAEATKVSVWGYASKSSQQKKKGGYYQVPDVGGYVKFVKREENTNVNFS